MINSLKPIHGKILAINLSHRLKINSEFPKTSEGLELTRSFPPSNEQRRGRVFTEEDTGVKPSMANMLWRYDDKTDRPDTYNSNGDMCLTSQRIDCWGSR